MYNPSLQDIGGLERERAHFNLNWQGEDNKLPPPPPLECTRGACIFQFSRERGYFWAVVSERFPEKKQEKGIFVVVGNFQW